MTQSLNQALERHWNKKLSSEYALAPREWKGRGRAKKLYEFYNNEYSLFCSNFVRSELDSMARDVGEVALAYGHITVFGIGLARGLDFIERAHELSMTVDLYDISEIAIRKAEDYLADFHYNGSVAVYPQELKGDEGEFISQETKLLYMANFLQILPPERMIAIGRRVGECLARTKGRAIIVHPSERGNETALWGDTTPYTLSELLQPVAEGLGDVVEILREEEINYFRCHKYKIFTIAAQSG